MIVYRYPSRAGLAAAQVQVDDDRVAIAFTSSATGRSERLELGRNELATLGGGPAMLSVGEHALARGEAPAWRDLTEPAKRAGMTVPDYIAQHLHDSFCVRALVPGSRLASMRECAVMLFMQDSATLETQEAVQPVDGPLMSRRLLEQLAGTHQAHKEAA